MFFVLLSLLTVGCGVIWGGVTYLSTAQWSFNSFQLGGGAGVSVYGTGIVQDTSGNIYVAGTVSGGIIGTMYNPHVTTDSYITKFDVHGNLIWTSQLGTNTGSAVYASGLVADLSGNVYISGWTNGLIGGTGWVQLGAHGSHDLFLSKFNSSGVLVWTSQWGVGGATTQANTATIDQSGNIYITGYTTGSIGTQFGTHGASDLCVVQVTSSGGAGWASQLGTLGVSAAGAGITLDASGNIYVVGNSTGMITGAQLTGTISTNTNALLAQLSPLGVVNWSAQIGGGGSTTTTLSGVATDASNNIRVAGTTSAILGGSQYGSHGTYDGTIGIYNNSGGLLSLSQIGAAGVATRFSAIAVDSSQNSFAAGQTYGAIGLQFGSYANSISNIFLAKYDSALNYHSSIQWGSVAGGSLAGVQIVVNGQTVYVPGYSPGFIGGVQYGTHGTEDETLGIVQSY